MCLLPTEYTFLRPRYINSLHGIYWPAQTWCIDYIPWVHAYTVGAKYIPWECRVGNILRGEPYTVGSDIPWVIYLGQLSYTVGYIPCGTCFRFIYRGVLYTVGNRSPRYIVVFPTVYIYRGGYTVGKSRFNDAFLLKGYECDLRCQFKPNGQRDHHDTRNKNTRIDGKNKIKQKHI